MIPKQYGLRNNKKVFSIDIVKANKSYYFSYINFIFQVIHKCKEIIFNNTHKDKEQFTHVTTPTKFIFVVNLRM